MVVIFKLLLSLLTQKVSKIQIQQKKRVLTQAKKFPALNFILLLIGLPQAIYVTKADVTDRNGAIEMFISTKNNLVKVQNMLVDSGYSGENFANAIRQILLCSVEVIKKSDLHTFKVMPKRWIVERTFSLKKIAVFGRTANANFLLPSK